MEHKSTSLKSRHHRRKSESSPRSPKLCSVDEFSDIHDVTWRENVKEIDNSVDINHVLDRIDQFINTLSLFDNESDFPIEIPEEVEMFSRILESKTAKLCSLDSDSRSGRSEDEDLFFIENVDRMSKLTNVLAEVSVSASSDTTSSLNRTTMVLQRAMLYLQEEIQNLLEDSKPQVVDPNEEQKNEEIYPPEVVKRIKRISSTMFSAGYGHECSQVYSMARMVAFHVNLTDLGFETRGIEDVQRMSWEQLEEKITTWIKTVKYVSGVLLVAERRLADAVFDPTTSSDIFCHLASSGTIPLISFVDGVVLTKRSSEKLFKYLDMYEALNELVNCVQSNFSDDLSSDLSVASDKIGGAAVYIFCDFENSIKGEAARTPVPGGAIHPLTRYVMNYIKYACEYSDALEQVFRKNKSLTRTISLAKSEGQDDISGSLKQSSSSSSSPFGVQLKTVVDLLNENLDSKAQLYRDVALRYIFLMNNGRYILQKIKGSKEILQLVGDTWYRTRSTVVRTYHKNYQRETWIKLLQCLSMEGLQVSGKVNKLVLKERFRSFTNMFDEIHRVQSTWVVSDEQLQSELRVAISAVVVPAYRSFLGRFKQYLASSRQPEKYVKYQPEDIETMIEGLFEGNSTSMSRRR